MEEGEKDQQCSIFSIIVKGNQEQVPVQDVKMPGSSSTSVKYTKSTHSVGSRESMVDMKITAIVENTHEAKKDTPAIVENTHKAKKPTPLLLSPPGNKTSTTETKKKSPKVRLSQVGVDNSLRVVETQGFSMGQKSSGAATCSGSEPKNTAELNAELKALKHVKDKKFKHRKHSMWYRLRRRHVHMGVVEVNSRHPFYVRLQAISMGMQSFFSDPNRLGPAENLDTEDYNLVQSREMVLKEGTPFLFENYAPAVFATIRRAVAVEEDAYMESIISRNLAYLEFISNSRSGQDFFLSPNMRYLIKTNKERDIRFLLSILGDYLKHFLYYPHSLLVKYLGCYSVKFPGKKKIFFLVMQNIFYPAERIEDRFDVKGCTAGRYQEPDPPGSHTITVLKDQNFFQEDLQLGTNREWFIKQLTADATFLSELNVMDYSLLVGRQKLQDTELDNGDLPDLVTRITRSGFIQSQSLYMLEDSNNLSQHTSDSINDPNRTGNELLPGALGIHGASVSKSSLTAVKNGLHFPHSLTNIEENYSSQRRRLLPNSHNALHIIDGPEYRYFFGIVDFLTRWTLKQKAARLWKVVKYGCGEHSTKPPQYYCQRFISFISTRVS